MFEIRVYITFIYSAVVIIIAKVSFSAEEAGEISCGIY